MSKATARGLPERRKQRMTILTVDPTQRLIQAKGRDGVPVTVALWEMPTAFRWPQVGEVWSVYYENNWPILGQRIQGRVEPFTIEKMVGDQAFIDSTAILDANGKQLSTQEYVQTNALATPNTVNRPARVFGQIYQPSATGATFVTVSFTMHLTDSTQSCVIQVNLDPTSPPLTQVGVASLSTGGTTAISTTSSISFMVPPGWYYEYSNFSTGSPTISMTTTECSL